MSDNNEKVCLQKSSIHLIASNINHEFQYNGFCKIEINYLQSLLFVEPLNEEFKLISAMFKWKFYSQKNILFVFGENKYQDFALVFKNEIKCKKVYDLICQKRAEDEITNEQIYRRILLPIFTQITKVANFSISELLKKWMNKLEKNDKKFYYQMLKDDEIYDLINLNDEKHNEKNDQNEVTSYRKRRFPETSENFDECVSASKVTGIKKKWLPAKCFMKNYCESKIVNIKGKNKLLKRLLVFTSDETKFCYEYRPHPQKSNIFYCIGCRKMNISVRAKMDANENLLLQNKNHVCLKAWYSAENYSELQIIKKPNYEILENTNTKNGKVLIIFNPINQKQCHEFRWRILKKSFYCVKCRVKAKVNNASKENEYIEMFQLNHDCEYRQYDREKYFKFNKFILAPDFELRTEMKRGKERKNLIILDKNDKTKCYVFNFRKSKKLFQCLNCLKQYVFNTAKMVQNSEGENYVILSNVEHVCEPVKYIPYKNESFILHSPDFKIMEKTSNGIPKVFIFDPKNKNLCYTFSLVTSDLNRKRYICLGCQFLAQKLSKKSIKSNRYVYIYLCKKENGENFVQTKNNQKHLCKPRKYEPEKYESKESFKTDKFFYYRKKAKPDSINIAIFDSNDATLCYPFSYSKASNSIYCLSCKVLKKTFVIPIPKTNENGKEYFVHDSKKHICKPKKVSTFQTSEFQKLERNEIAFKEKWKPKINEEKIVKLPNFDFRPNKSGNPEGKLVVSDVKDKSMFYEFYFATEKKMFICSKCQVKKHRVTAKVHTNDKNGEKFIELSKNEHICEPIKDEYKDKIIEASNFIVLDRDDETKNTRIHLYTSETKEFYYELRYVVAQNIFQCNSCTRKHKFVAVKLLTKESGEEYLLKMKNEHICTPKKYDEPPKIIPASMFELYKNIKREPNKKLVIFTSEKKDFIYEYYWLKNSFYCLKCSNQKPTAKLLGEENEKYVELSKTEHVCQPMKYNPKRYRK